MSGDESGPALEGEATGRTEPFFSGAHWARIAFMALLLTTSAGTMGQAIWQLAQTSQQVTGEFVEVAESRTGTASAIYSLVLRNETGDPSFVRLRNNGRIHKYLMNLGNGVIGRVIVEESRGIAGSLTLVDEDNLRIRESRVSPHVQLIIGALLLIIFALHIGPR